LALSGGALLGFAYHVPGLHRIFFFSTISLNTALALFLLSVSSIVADPATGWAAVIASARAGGGPTRRQLFFCIAPLLGGGLLLQSVRAGSMSIEAAITFLVLLTLIPLLVLILRDGKVLDARDKRINTAIQYHQQVEGNLAAQLASQARGLNAGHDQRLIADAVVFKAQRMEAMGQLTGGFAHEFNNLLMALTSIVHLLRLKIATHDIALPYLDQISAITDRGTKLTQQLIVFSSTQRLDVRAVELRPTLEQARELIGTALGPGVEIAMSLPPLGLWVETDTEQLQLAILNLALNARDAMPAGGNLRISTSGADNGNADETLNPYVSIHIADNGIGMSNEIAAKAAEPFFTTKAQGDGTGLGLAQVYGFVTQCGGELKISSQEGIGTTIDLMLREATPSDIPDTQVASPHSSTSLAPPDLRAPLLLVDDDDHVRAAMSEVLRVSGFVVKEAANGKAALDALTVTRPSVAIIDYLMPGINGVDVAKAARARYPSLPIIFVSGYSDTAALAQIVDAAVFRKPVPLDELISTINAMVA
jgi:signal transduction histidine kinase/CheY-like chemotaxis protein